MLLDEKSKKEIADINRYKGLDLDIKQHCQKILQGIGKFNNNTAHRAIWELVQNARDQAESDADGIKSVRIRIELRNENLLFAHDGRHFNYDSLSSLIKQVSSEEKEDRDSAGQFGTGFMTTHKFSRIIEINSSYEISPGLYVPLRPFKIDRSADDLPGMRYLMKNQLIELDKLLDQDCVSTKSKWTEFVYKTDTDERKNAALEGVTAALILMPYVMTINERIIECRITDKQGQVTLFRKQVMPEVEGLHVMRIWKNDIPTDFFYLQSVNRQDIIFLPLKTAVEANAIGDVPRMFIYFPLLGTEVNSINYIYHSERFYPSEPRDQIVLPDGNSEHQKQIDHDVLVLSEMSDLLFSYLKEHASKINKGIYLAPIGFDLSEKNKQTSDFLAQRHKLWVDVFRELPLIEVAGAKYSISQTDKVRVLDNKIVNFLREPEHAKYLEIVYRFANKVSPLPYENEVLDWSDIVYQWDPDESTWYVTIDDIVGKITEMGEKEELKAFLSFLKESKQTDFFKTNNIIPNREGELRSVSYLRNGKSIPEELYRVCKPIVPDFTNMLVDEEFVFLYDFSDYTRDDLKTALSLFVEGEEKSLCPYQTTLLDIIRFCLTFPTEYPENNDRYKAMSVICSHYTCVPFVMNYVPHLGDVDKEQLMYKVVFDSLVKFEFKRIEQAAANNPQWFHILDNANYLQALLTSLSNMERPTSYQKKIMPDYAIFPNQQGTLCKAGDLLVIEDDSRHPFSFSDVQELNGYYIQAMDFDKRDVWVDGKFAEFQEFNKEDLKSMATKIEEKLRENNYQPKYVIEIIRHLDNNEPIWIYWFNNINDNKAHIFFYRIQGDSHKRSVYTLMKMDEEKLNELANLVESDQLGEIIKEGIKAIERQKYQQRHNNFITDLGQYVENALLNELKGQIEDDVLKVEVCDFQGGQDYLVKVNNEVVYYIEVKSRWKTSEVVEMSPLQFQTAVDHQDCYALCYVDMTWKNAEEIKDRFYDDTTICVQHTKVLSDIGKRSKWCLDSVQRSETRPHIGGNYSLTVPQNLFKQEPIESFDDMVSIIQGVVKMKLNL